MVIVTNQQKNIYERNKIFNKNIHKKMTFIKMNVLVMSKFFFPKAEKNH